MHSAGQAAFARINHSDPHFIEGEGSVWRYCGVGWGGGDFTRDQGMNESVAMCFTFALTRVYTTISGRDLGTTSKDV